MSYLGDFAALATVNFAFTTHDKDGGAVAPSTALEAADLDVYKNASATPRSSANGITMTSPFAATTGLHHVSIDTSDNTDAGFWAAGSDYIVVLTPDETVDSETVVRVVAQFSIARLLGANHVVPDPAGTAAALHVITDAAIAALVVPDAAGTAAALHVITDAAIAALVVPDPAGTAAALHVITDAAIAALVVPDPAGTAAALHVITDAAIAALVVPDPAGTAAALHVITDAAIAALVVPDPAGTAAALHVITDAAIAALIVPDPAGTAAALHVITDAAIATRAPAATALSTAQWTNARAGYLDELAAANLPADVAAVLAAIGALPVPLTAALTRAAIGLAAANLDAQLAAILAAAGLSAQQVRDAMKLAPTAGAPAAGSVDKHLDDILALAGPGITPWPVIIRMAAAPHLPLAHVLVQMTTDAAGLNVVAGPLLTNALGVVQPVFMLHSGTTYYMWCERDGYTFTTNPTVVTVP